MLFSFVTSGGKVGDEDKSACRKTAEPGAVGQRAQARHRVLCRAPDPAVPAQRVTFGASGHSGSAFDKAFNEWHIWSTLLP